MQQLYPATTSSRTDAATALELQRLRILRCTAHALLSSPGGLRFRAGSQPWLSDLSEASRCAPLSAAQVPAKCLSLPSPAGI